MGEPDGAAHEQPVPCIEGSPSVVGAEIVRIHWEARSARGVAVGIVQTVVAEERQLGAGSNVEIRDQLILAEDSIRRVLIDRGRGRWGRTGSARRRSVDVQR